MLTGDSDAIVSDYIWALDIPLFQTLTSLAPLTSVYIIIAVANYLFAHDFFCGSHFLTKT